jgi:hypothetical protein
MTLAHRDAGSRPLPRTGLERPPAVARRAGRRLRVSTSTARVTTSVRAAARAADPPCDRRRYGLTYF